MEIQRFFLARKISATLAAAAGVVALGLLATPVASADDVNACTNVDPTNGACLDPDQDRHSVPDPTQYGCAPRDFDCMFKHALPPK